ncbi:MAG: multifunctional CCA addition/repair protein [Gammaproteobacteria bacterium]
MQIYLVGGAVRDELLGRPVTERDWVVVGATPEVLVTRGFRQVGKDFPVFLHPETGEEYALARTERKTGPGYHGFVTRHAPDVTLEQDLLRRDLTINAMARAADGTLVDPCGGRIDLERRILRHVSPAFAEDPLRILRVARFAARYAPLGFTVAAETLELMRGMVAAGEVASLVPERIWQETVRALAEPRPRTYLEVLRACGALAVLLPELDRLWGIPQPTRHHPEVDTGEHMLLCLDAAVAMAAGPRVRFAVLLHDLGKGVTPPAEWPRHIAHEARGVPLVRAVCERWRVPTDFRELAELACREHLRVHRALELRADTVLELLEACDAFRRRERFAELLDACTADQRGRLGREADPYPQRDRLAAALAAAAAVQLEATERTGLSGPAIGAALRARRLAAVSAVLGQAR